MTTSAPPDHAAPAARPRPLGASRRARRRRRRFAVGGLFVAIVLVAVAVGLAANRSSTTGSAPTTTLAVPADFSANWQSVVGEAAIRTRVGPTNPDRLKTVDGDFTALVPGQTFENLAVRGTIRVTASNVTIRNFTARNVEIAPDAREITLERGRLDGLGNPKNTTDGVSFNDFTARGLEISRQIDGFKAMGNVTIEDCWVHDLNGLRGPGTGAGDYSHNDAVQVSVGSNVAIRRNRFERPGLNSAVFVDADQGPISNVLIENNFLDGGTFTLYVIKSRSAPQNGMPEDVVVRNNIFGSAAIYGAATIGPGVTFTGNVTEQGRPVTAKADDESQ